MRLSFRLCERTTGKRLRSQRTLCETSRWPSQHPQSNEFNSYAMVPPPQRPAYFFEQSAEDAGPRDFSRRIFCNRSLNQLTVSTCDIGRSKNFKSLIEPSSAFFAPQLEAVGFDMGAYSELYYLLWGWRQKRIIANGRKSMKR